MSRDLKDLHPDMRPLVDDFIASCAKAHIELLVTCTWRSPQEQAALYAQGRTTLGKIVTRAKPGQSMHNFTLKGRPASLAVDVVPMVNGKPVWSSSDPLWRDLGLRGEFAGLEWAGRWLKFREYPHFQHPNAKAIQGAMT